MADGGLLDALAAPFDAGASLLTGTYGQVDALANQGLLRALGGSSDFAKQQADRIQAEDTYQPRTYWGARALNALGNAFEGAANSAPIRAIADPISNTLLKAGVQPGDIAGLTGAAGLLVGGPEAEEARVARAARAPETPAIIVRGNRGQTVANPVRNEFSGIYDDPRSIVQNANVAPEDPILHQLFGVTRKDLSDVALSREGNLPGQLPGMAANPKGSKAATSVMTPENESRLTNILDAARARPDLFQGMTGWYVTDPLYQKFVSEFGSKDAPEAFKRFNTLVGMASPGSDVLTEVNRGTAAHMMAQQGRFDDFVRYGGMAADRRGADYPSELANVIGHPYHSTAQAIPMQRYLESGSVQMDSPKVPMYVEASGVPETGFQTRTPVGDAHWSRGVGLADVRTNKAYGASVTTPEMSQLGPWWRDRIAAPSGLEAVPAQALLWGTLGRATGVDTAIGAPKLELLAQQVRKAAARAGVSPQEMLQRVIRGGAHAGAVGGLGLLTLGGDDNE